MNDKIKYSLTVIDDSNCCGLVKSEVFASNIGEALEMFKGEIFMSLESRVDRTVVISNELGYNMMFHVRANLTDTDCITKYESYIMNKRG